MLISGRNTADDLDRLYEVYMLVSGEEVTADTLEQLHEVCVGGDTHLVREIPYRVLNIDSLHGGDFRTLCSYCGGSVDVLDVADMIALCEAYQNDQPLLHAWCEESFLSSLREIKIKPPATDRGVTFSQAGKK